MDFLAKALDFLENDALDEMQDVVAREDQQTLNSIFMDLFGVMIRKYDDSVDDDEKSQKLAGIIHELVVKAGMKPKELYISLMDAFESVSSPDSVGIVIDLLIETIPELSENLLLEIQENVLPTLLEEQIILRLSDGELAHDDILRTSMRFIQLFRSCKCAKVELIDRLMLEVLSCLPQSSTTNIAVIDECSHSYVNLGGDPIKSTLLIARSQDSTEPCISLVYSPEYRFELCLSPLTTSLNVNFISEFNITMVLNVLQGFVLAIPRCTLSREIMPTFMGFLGALLVTCQEMSLSEGVHRRCMRMFENVLECFEPVAQLLILRRLIRLLQTGELKVQLESQVFGMLLDEYCRGLHKFQEFRDEIGYIWAQLQYIHYSDLHQSVHFTTALLVLAQHHALSHLNKEVLREVQMQLLDPLQTQIADWTTLANAEEDERIDSLPFIQFSMSQTRECVKRALDQ